MTTTTKPCPICGGAMRQTRRGATLARRGPAYVCPAAEAEQYRDERGHIATMPGAVHPYLRSWQPGEIGREETSRCAV